MCRHFHLAYLKLKMFHIWIFTLRLWEMNCIISLLKMCQCLPSPRNMFKKAPDLTARLYDLWPIMISKFWYELIYEIFIYFVNVVYLNKCAHTIKSLNLTDSVQNVWQKILIASSPSSFQKFTLRDAWILDIILIFLMFEFQLFFTLWIERGSFN